MNGGALSREAALRIGLAARVLPGVDARRLIRVLTEKIGLPLTEQRLARVTVTHLKTGFASLDGEEDGEDAGIGMEHLKLAVRYLWGKEIARPELPVPSPYREGELPGSIRVAVASNGGETVDGHFGSCPYFQVSPGEIRLIDVRSTEGAGEADDKNAFRVGLISDCCLVYVQSVGGPAAAKIVRAGIHPVKLPEGGHAPEILVQLQSVMAGSPPPWLAKVLGVPAEKRVRFAPGEPGGA